MSLDSSTKSRKGKASPSSSIDEEYDFGSDTDEGSMDARDLSSDESDFEDGESASDGGLGRSHGSDLAGPFKLRLMLRQPKGNEEGGGPAEEDGEEKSKIEEGAEALLNLAGIVTSRSASPTGSTHNNNNTIERAGKDSPATPTSAGNQEDRQEEDMDQS